MVSEFHEITVNKFKFIGLVSHLNKRPHVDDSYLQNLPSELWLNVVEHLEARDKRKLKMTNRRLYHLLELDMKKGIERKRSFMNSFRSEASVYMTEVSELISVKYVYNFIFRNVSCTHSGKKGKRINTQVILMFFLKKSCKGFRTVCGKLSSHNYGSISIR